MKTNIATNINGDEVEFEDSDFQNNNLSEIKKWIEQKPVEYAVVDNMKFPIRLKPPPNFEFDSRWKFTTGSVPKNIKVGDVLLLNCELYQISINKNPTYRTSFSVQHAVYVSPKSRPLEKLDLTIPEVVKQFTDSFQQAVKLLEENIAKITNNGRYEQ